MKEAQQLVRRNTKLFSATKHGLASRSVTEGKANVDVRNVYASRQAHHRWMILQRMSVPQHDQTPRPMRPSSIRMMEPFLDLLEGLGSREKRERYR